MGKNVRSNIGVGLRRMRGKMCRWVRVGGVAFHIVGGLGLLTVVVEVIVSLG